jgi:MFS family permease
LYILPFAAGNFLGPLILGLLFDVIGRRPMIASTYVASGVLLTGSGAVGKPTPMMFFIITATMVVVGAFILGWLKGYQKSSQARGWNVPKINQKNDTNPPPTP